MTDTVRSDQTATPMPRLRLDQHLVALGLFESRAQAAAAIKAGRVYVNGDKARKASQAVSPHDDIHASAAHDFVSRGGLKLDAALAHFNYSVKDKTLVDVGASTGGFTDVALRSGAAFVYALDVGHGQLHASLCGHARVQNLEKHNARHAQADWFAHPIHALVCDVSFISLKLALDRLLDLVHSQGWAIMLIKPQFEVGKAQLGKNGVVTDPASRQQICDDMVTWINNHKIGWSVDGVIESPITGPQGNVEFLLGARKK